MAEIRYDDLLDLEEEDFDTVLAKDINFTGCPFMLKINFFLASCKGNIIDIYTDDIAVEQFCFNKGSAAACELIQHQIALV